MDVIPKLDCLYWVTSLYLIVLCRPSSDGRSWVGDRLQYADSHLRENPERDGPCFFEVKKKRSTSTKTRGNHQEWPCGTALTDGRGAESGHAEGLCELAEFYRLSQRITPIQFPKPNQYRRIAWFGLHEDYVCINHDTNMRWREEREFDFAFPLRTRGHRICRLFHLEQMRFWN